MNEQSAFRGTLSAIKPLKSRETVQFIIEVEGAENANMALEVMGGFLKPGQSRWVAVARLADNIDEIGNIQEMAAGTP